MLTVKDVAARLKISRACVYQLIARGKIAHIRIGCGRGAIRIAEDDLHEFLNSCKVEQEHPRDPHSLKHIKLRA